MNEAWKTADADAHAAKAEALDNAIRNLEGLEGALDTLETQAIRQTLGVLQRAHKRHESAAKLLAAV